MDDGVTDPFSIAMIDAGRGLRWDYPCLLWMADYLLRATGRDIAIDYRSARWTETKARRTLAVLSRVGLGSTAVECAMDGLAYKHSWQEADGPRQGAVMVGVYNIDGDVGAPAIFDGDRRWLHAGAGIAVVTARKPDRMWEVP